MYDNKFLIELVHHKNDFNNLLLLWLVIDNPTDFPIANRLFEEIEENLKLLQSKDIDIFKAKLTQWHTVHFESAITELEFIAEYLRRGYHVEIEPNLPNNRKGDFCAIKDSMKIYFEVKTIYTEPSMKDRAIMDDLSDFFYRMGSPFRISIDLAANMSRDQTVEVSRYIQRKLRGVEIKSIKLPFSFAYPEDSEPIITVDVLSRLPDGKKGYISGFVFGGGIKGDGSNLRRKISSGVSQLHPNYPGVIIVKPHGLETTKYDIENAIFGDLKVTLLGTTQFFRGGDRIFAKNKNKRLSAIIYYEKRLHASGYTMKKFVYHNPYASKTISNEVFSGENVTQI